MTRVLQITTVPLTMRLFIMPLAQALADMGYRVELACNGSEQWDSPFPSYQISLDRRPFHPANIRGLLELVRLLRSRRYDVVHVHTPVAGAVGRVAAHTAGVPRVIYTLHGSFWGTRPAWRAVVFDVLERALAPWTSHVVVQNDDDAADLLGRCRLAPERMTRLPAGGAGVDLTAFAPCRFPVERVKALRHTLGLGEFDTVVGYVGRLDRDKGIRELLQAFVCLGRDHRRLRLLLVGYRVAGDRDTATDELTRELSETVVCTGFRDDVPAMLACMDVLVSPSYRDGFGMALAEAAAMGKAVVATNTRGSRAVVIDGVTGLLSSIGDVAALAEGIRTLVDDPVVRARMGVAGRQLAVERFDRRRVLEIYQAIYTCLLES